MLSVQNEAKIIKTDRVVHSIDGWIVENACEVSDDSSVGTCWQLTLIAVVSVIHNWYVVPLRVFISFALISRCYRSDHYVSMTSCWFDERVRSDPCSTQYPKPHSIGQFGRHIGRASELYGHSIINSPTVTAVGDSTNYVECV